MHSALTCWGQLNPDNRGAFFALLMMKRLHAFPLLFPAKEKSSGKPLNHQRGRFLRSHINWVTTLFDILIGNCHDRFTDIIQIG